MGIVEPMIALAVAAILFIAAVPAFTAWMQNAQTRTAAESVLNGLQLARAEAVARNAAVRFRLVGASGVVAWQVGCVNAGTDCPATIQRRAEQEGAENARAGASTLPLPGTLPAGYFDTPLVAGQGLPAGVSFNGMGRVANPGGDITRIDVTNTVSPAARRYVVTVGAGGGIRMCDPALAFEDSPQGCR